ncbi:MAG: hypothetical protein N4A47_01425 [Clostridia bacterium]|jgi:hypothetical protein|nr:hypothetical protein [Clostridia bacterium]
MNIIKNDLDRALSKYNECEKELANLSVFQWKKRRDLSGEIRRLTDEIENKAEELECYKEIIEDKRYQNSRRDRELARLNSLIEEMKESEIPLADALTITKKIERLANVISKKGIHEIRGLVKETKIAKRIIEADTSQYDVLEEIDNSLLNLEDMKIKNRKDNQKNRVLSQVSEDDLMVSEEDKKAKELDEQIAEKTVEAEEMSKSEAENLSRAYDLKKLNEVYIEVLKKNVKEKDMAEFVSNIYINRIAERRRVSLEHGIVDFSERDSKYMQAIKFLKDVAFKENGEEVSEDEYLNIFRDFIRASKTSIQGIKSHNMQYREDRASNLDDIESEYKFKELSEVGVVNEKNAKDILEAYKSPLHKTIDSEIARVKDVYFKIVESPKVIQKNEKIEEDYTYGVLKMFMNDFVAEGQCEEKFRKTNINTTTYFEGVLNELEAANNLLLNDYETEMFSESAIDSSLAK